MHGAPSYYKCTEQKRLSEEVSTDNGKGKNRKKKQKDSHTKSQLMHAVSYSEIKTEEEYKEELGIELKFFVFVR